MGKKPPYPNASVMINAQDAIIWGITRTNEEVGLVMREMDQDLLWGRWEKVAALPFTGRIYKRAPQSRPGMSQSIKDQVLCVGECVACGATRRLEVDHVVPYSRGGPHGIENLQVLCRPCNRAKGAQTMEEWGAADGLR